MDVANWLRGLGLQQYAEAFRANAIDDQVLPRLTADDLTALGVTSVGHRRKLLDAIAALRDRTPPPSERSAQSHAASIAPRVPEAERRQLTLMFVDLVGSTALSRHLDPEEMGELLRAYQDVVATCIARFGGHVAKLMGDGVLAYFGWPQAQEDAAERAVRAALAVSAEVARLRTPEGKSLAARVGIATGPVVVGEIVGEGPAREETVVGETPNLAARLQQAAAPGGVVLAEGTRRLLGEIFELDAMEPLTLAGFAEPVPTWRVLREAQAECRFAARHAAGAMPLIGRERELALLIHRWKQAKAGEGQIVLLAGEPGIGKSRLVLALRERIPQEPCAPLLYQCSPHHTSSALHPVVAQLERAAGFARQDDPAMRLEKLGRLLGEVASCPDEPLALLAALLGLPADALPEMTPQERKTRTFYVLLDQLETLTRRPTLIVLEDAHWIDPTSEELFGVVAERIQNLPVLLVVTFRPEYRPPWAGHAHATALSLSRLPRRDAATIVEQVAGKALPQPVLAEITAKTDGVPLFVEELTKTVLESGLLADEGGRYGLKGPLPPLAIPATLQDSLLARLDHLAPVKEVAQVGSVIGREFGHELLAAVALLPPDRLAAALDELTASELVFRRGLSPEATYVFKHALVRDAAYSTLLKSRRQQLHARVAEALEQRFAHVVESQPEILAYHCAEAGLIAEAVDYRYRAGRQTAARSALVEAVTQFEQGLALIGRLPIGAERDRRELDFQLALGAALIATRGWAVPEVGQAYERARKLCTETAHLPQLLAALSGLYVHHLHWSELGVAFGLAEELLRLAEQRQDRAARAAGHRFVGACSMWRGRLDAVLPHLERALALLHPADRELPVYFGQSDSRITCLGFAGLVRLYQGYPDQALARMREGLAAADELGQAYSTCQALYLSCWLHQVRGEPEIVLERTAELIALAEEKGFPSWAACGIFFRGWALAAEGKFEEGLRMMERSLAARYPMAIRLQLPHYQGLLAGAHLAAGNPTKALARLDDAVMDLDSRDERWFEAELHRLRGEALLHSTPADPAAAEICLQKGIEVARSQGAKWWELRAAISLARLWAGRGEQRKAHDLLAPVYDWFTEGFDTRDLKDAKALLDAVAAAASNRR